MTGGGQRWNRRRSLHHCSWASWIRPPWRYEVIRPLVLFADRTAQQRAQETHTYPDTVRTLQRRFRQQGMRGTPPRRFSQALFPRTTNRYGCVTLHNYHFYVEAGLPQTQVLLWMAGEQLRAVFANVVLAVYHCRYDWQDRKAKDIRRGCYTRHGLRPRKGSSSP
jgi:hypothetical protein